MVIKTIEPEHPFAPGGREALLGQITTYRKRLQAIGVPVSEQYQLTLEGDHLVERTPFCGPDGFTLLQDGKRELVIPAIVRALLPILAQDQITVTIDGHPANWCFDGSGTIRYVDFHPARYLQGSTFIVGFPQPVAERELSYSLGRYYCPTGIVRSLRFSAIRAGGRRAEELIYATMREYYPESVRQPIFDALEALPEHAVRGGANVENALRPLGVWHIDDVREVAMAVADRMSADAATEFLGEILELTRGDFARPLEQRAKLMEQAKELIIAKARLAIAA